MIHFGIIIFILAAYWFPRIGPLGRSMREIDGSGRELRNDALNPLLDRGYLRKNRKKSNGISLMWDIRGLYWCQIQAIIQIIVIIFLELSLGDQKGYVYEVIWKILAVWILTGIIIYYCIGYYYISAIRKNYKEETDIKKKWKPFQRYEELQTYAETMNYQEDFAKVQNKVSVYFRKKGNTEKISETIHADGLFQAYITKTGSRVEIFALIKTEILSDTVIEELNEIYQKKIQNKLKGNIAMSPVFFVYLICVQKASQEFKSLIGNEIIQKKDKYCLPTGIVFDEKKLYIAGQKDEYGQAEYQYLKDKISNILGVSINAEEKNEKKQHEL